MQLTTESERIIFEITARQIFRYQKSKPSESFTLENEMGNVRYELAKDQHMYRLTPKEEAAYREHAALLETGRLEEIQNAAAQFATKLYRAVPYKHTYTVAKKAFAQSEAGKNELFIYPDYEQYLAITLPKIDHVELVDPPEPHRPIITPEQRRRAQIVSTFEVPPRSAEDTNTRIELERESGPAERTSTSEDFLKRLSDQVAARSPVTIHTEKGWAERERQKDKNGAEIERGA